jgi:hypothetical protein
VRRTIVLAVTLIVILAIVVGYIGLTGLNGNQPATTPNPSVIPTASAFPQASPTMSLSPELKTQEQIRDAVISYIRIQHNQTAPYMQGFMWNGGMMSPGMMVGASTYSYQSNGWNVTMQYPITLNPIYTITANYTSPVSEVFPARNMIMWSGTWQNGTISETGYSFTP